MLRQQEQSLTDRHTDRRTEGQWKKLISIWHLICFTGATIRVTYIEY